MSTTLIILLIAAILVFLFIGMYNGFVSGKNKVDEAWSSISVQLKRRYDLIPNIVETVKGYATHEKDTFERLVKARSAAVQVGDKDVAAQAQAQVGLSQAIRSVMVLSENYPELRSNQNFLGLQSTLSEIENDIQNSRRYYNGTVRDYNTSVEKFPNALIANTFGFKTREFFELDSVEESKNVKVQF